MRNLSANEFVLEAFRSSLRPLERLSIADWADRFRFLSTVSSAEPGKWRTSRTPYLKAIMEDLSPTSPVQEVIFKKGSQIGASESGVNWLLFIMARNPGPSLMLQPTDGLAKRFAKQRLDVAIQDCPEIQKIISTKGKDPNNNTVEKEFPGGILIISGSRTAATLKSMPVRNLFLDEIDEYKQDLDGQGDPIALAEVRARTFQKRKIFKVSSPTLETTSRIEQAFEKGSKKRFFVPCPHCQHKQLIEWDRIVWPKGEPEKASLKCISCGVLIEEHFKTKMLASGQWISTNEKPYDPRIQSYHLSALYSPLGWFSWGEAASKFEDIGNNVTRLIVFVNTILGEVWREKGEAPEYERLFNLRENYAIGRVPRGGMILTAGVDVQANRFEIEVVAWGRNKETWSIEYLQIPCDTSKPESYKLLDQILEKEYLWGDSAKIKISCLAIDSGFNTNLVYQFTRGKSPRVIAIKGRDSHQGIVARPTQVDINYQGKKIKRGTTLYSVGVSQIKFEIYGYLRLEPPETGQPFPSGYCHFPQYDMDYFKGLCSEEVVKTRVRGFYKHLWKKVFDRNEALDLRVYARAAAYVYGIDFLDDNQWNEIQQNLEDVNLKSKNFKTKGGIKIKKSDYL